jgi:hypothetical protein
MLLAWWPSAQQPMVLEAKAICHCLGWLGQTYARSAMTDQAGGDQDKPTFSELSSVRCVELLQSHTIGRVAWHAADAPEILPVTYVWYEDSVIFRTSPHGPLSQLSQPTDVAFEIDELDQQHHQGWSVVVHGQAQGIVRPADVVHLWAVSGVPWAAGMRNLLIRITPTQVTGRLVAAARD